MTGAFWFRSARLFFQAADHVIANNLRVNREFYVDTVVEWLVENGARCAIFEVDHYISMGTPDDVRTYEYWQAYFAKLDGRKAHGVPRGEHRNPVLHSPAVL